MRFAENTSRRLFSLTLAAAALGACTALATDPDGVPIGADPVPTLRLDAATQFRAFSGIDSRERLVVRDAAHWEALWARMAARVAPTPPVPEVDFTSQMLIVAAMGSQLTGGYSIEVEAVSATSDEVFVEVLSRAPGPQCVTRQALTQPLDVVRIARYPGPVRFVERAREYDCS